MLRQVLVAEAQTQHPPNGYFGHRALDAIRIVVLTEAEGESLDDAHAALGIGKQDCAAIRTRRSSAETSHDSSTPYGHETEHGRRTLGTRRSSLS